MTLRRLFRMLICAALISLPATRLAGEEVVLPFEPLEKKLGNEINNEAFFTELRAKVDPTLPDRGNQGMEGFNFVGLRGDTTWADGKLIGEITLWSGIKLGFPGNNDVYSLIRTALPIRLERGALAFDWDKLYSRPADVRTNNGGLQVPGLPNWGGAGGRMRSQLIEEVEKNFTARLRPKLEAAVNEALRTQLQQRGLDEAVLAAPLFSGLEMHHDKLVLSVDPSSPASGPATAARDLIFSPPPFSHGREGLTSNEKQAIPARHEVGGRKEEAVLVATLFHDHLWLFRGICKRPGGGHLNQAGGNAKLDRDDQQHQGISSVTLFLAEDAVLDRFGVGSVFRNDGLRTIAIRPGPKYAGHELRLFEHHRDTPGVPPLDLGIGDFILTATPQPFHDRASALEVVK